MMCFEMRRKLFAPRESGSSSGPLSLLTHRGLLCVELELGSNSGRLGFVFSWDAFRCDHRIASSPLSVFFSSLLNNSSFSAESTQGFGFGILNFFCT